MTERRVAFAVPGDLSRPTGGYEYDRRIIQGLRALDWSVDLVGLGDGFPFPPESVSGHAEGRLGALEPGTTVVIDGLACGALPDAVERLARKLNLVALVHHPLCLEQGLARDEAEELHRTERAALREVRQVIVTSAATAQRVGALFGLAADRIRIVEPGTPRARRAQGSGGPDVRLLSVGSVVPRKGYDVLFEALASMAGLDWRLDIVGERRDPACCAELEARLVRSGLADRIRFFGALPPGRLAACYERADIFVLASRYEGYGMAFAEALAHGLPVIGSGGEAVRATLSRAGAIYVEPEDSASLAEALQRLIASGSERVRVGDAAWQAAGALPRWDEAAARFAACLEEAR
ncbi:glycosyltransferase family 4 protein [Polymorphum gilvum]|uniref:Glycosyl transferase, group 1 n=1 Tax=Polymorphum gilvum (strain LMG 25793 / CGMCC 1.9160 / SL003B-26A1) TaxID=991905 RepID=F2J5H6_POLGS|nr:glycosyltransferase family 4 protein [Polymorphum gilvum]ADZ72346.1 Glycosyl transferase, group 1 [Polymorphum gilvum SL003B-26A1]